MGFWGVCVNCNLQKRLWYAEFFEKSECDWRVFVMGQTGGRFLDTESKYTKVLKILYFFIFYIVDLSSI